MKTATTRPTLAQRREALLAQSAQQRTELAAQVAGLQRTAHLVDSGISLVSGIAKKPLWIAGAAAVVMLWRSRRKTAKTGRFSKLLRTGLFLWKSLGWIKALRARPPTAT